MIKAGVGSSKNKNSRIAAEEAAREALVNAGIARAAWGLVFATFPHRDSYGEILNSVSDTLGSLNVAGCSAIGVIAGSREIEAEEAVAVLAVSSEGVMANSFLINDSGDGGLSAGVAIAHRASAGVSPNSLIALFPDPFVIHPEFLLRGVESRLGDVAIVGASASEHPHFDSSYQFGAGSVASGAVSGIILEGALSYKIGITQGCQPVGPPCKITKADGNIIFELDGLSAFDVLKSKVPSALLDNPNELLSLVFAGFPINPEGRIAGGDYLVRNLIGVNPASGIVGVAENVREGQMITFALRHPAMAREDLKQMLGRIAGGGSAGARPAFGLYFNCSGRGSSLYGHSGIDTAYIANAIGDVPIIGFFGNSEFAPFGGENRVFTYTGVLALIYDT
ncbi:MAG: FIST signal transduction protein [Deltaproteobacteria bacterium]